MFCKFSLYDETKKYFELNVLQNFQTANKNNSKDLKSIELYEKFFKELIVILKDEYNLKYCYSSRLKIRKTIDN